MLQHRLKLSDPAAYCTVLSTQHALSPVTSKHVYNVLCHCPIVTARIWLHCYGYIFDLWALACRTQNKQYLSVTFETYSIWEGRVICAFGYAK